MSMSRGLVRRVCRYGLISLVLAAAFMVWRRFNKDPGERPLFYTVYKAHDRWPFPFWQADPPPHSDADGNIYYVDTPLNLLVVIQTGLHQGAFPDLPRSTPESASITIPKLGRTFMVARQTDRLVLFGSSGESHALALRAGEARAMYDRCRFPTEDGPLPLERIIHALATRPGASTRASATKP